ncbi:E3 ubiquitin-protein ligase NEURL3-like [Alosa sapidissima]|uniref:E3 ubiquitin-protein ligase NEURL3-like n=1 Tax=Alosa sapidissima TaxID=34773 RepID=UPI001C096742|nr:E3 ubiquitin-protein ligase NEURL3-like [Alosa sapidissima]
MTNNVNERTKDPHVCGLTCLGPLTFHPGAVGKKITLSHGNCRASRDLETFRDGLVFSSRPVKPREKVQFRVERSLLAWEGGVRVGFTNVCPTTAGPLPPLACPDLADKPGYWALPVPQRDCPPGTMVSFWMDSTGLLCYKTPAETFCNQTDLDLSRPLWAIIDVYGQSTTVLLLGSVRRLKRFIKTSSCPIPRSTFECGYEDTPPELKKRKTIAERKLKQHQEDQSNNNNSQRTGCSKQDLCAVCLDREARLAPQCGHRCLCLPCANRVFEEFGTCPLCRQII